MRGMGIFCKCRSQNPKEDGSHQYPIYTIEIGTKPKPYCTLTHDRLHKKIHVLLCCYEHQWGELYVKKRKSKYDDTEPDVNGQS